MKHFFLTAAFVMISALFTVNAFAGGKTEKIPEGKIAVAASFNAMQELTRTVGKDKVYIHTIIPPGIEAHDFEPKAGDLKFLTQAQAVVYNGLGMEPWLKDALHAVKREDIKTICASTDIEPIELAEDRHHHEDDHDEHEHGHHTDPHVWLSLESAKLMVRNIANGLSEIDPSNAVFYKTNAETFIAEADTLLEKYRRDFAQLTRRHFVTGHAAFGYLCRDFGLEQRSVEDVFSAGEPSAQQLAKLADYCNLHGIKTVFSENAANPQVSETLAKEAGASVQTIYTIESAEDGLSYMERMRANIENIYKSLAQ